METKELSILVIGAGAVGGITAALLKKDGYNVEIVSKYPEYATLISEQGIEVTGACGNVNAKIPAYASVGEVKGKKDLILHATKATDMIEAAESVKSLLKDEGYVISMQNGICIDDMALVLGRNRLIGCITGWGATMDSHGKLTMTSTGDFVIGYPDRAPDDFLQSVGEVLSTVVPVKLTDNFMGHLYAKLIINSCITSLGAICGLYLGRMLSIKKVRKIFIEIIREAVLIADKLNIRIEVFGDKLNFYKFLSGNNIIADLRRHLFIMVIGFKYRKLKSSSLQSLERGKLTEIDYLNGYIVKNADRFHLEVPVNRAVVNIIHEIEQGKRKISFNNFSDPIFDRFNN
ncbi:MAG TPA: 2-dehydropantoate 2-reductase [Bacteroidales bacterium]|jgi:2-dehydropantoate 2-reductase|nr:2-dehydropantoate 2-reductase [Bacteroidales bacterium]NMD02314.1 2-dehydropantoate 2-reductase [Bacteroidales bacterium]HQG63036.1 2-dehydropantoate 2-reductase [Bacteroidales bacterium]HQK67575.1 2-dehydropantoate 2-reductase [Bacteroidales bacterium]